MDTSYVFSCRLRILFNIEKFENIIALSSSCFALNKKYKYKKNEKKNRSNCKDVFLGEKWIDRKTRWPFQLLLILLSSSCVFKCHRADNLWWVRREVFTGMSEKSKSGQFLLWNPIQSDWHKQIFSPKIGAIINFRPSTQESCVFLQNALLNKAYCSWKMPIK